MKYLSVCSGIEAATVAWHNLGWQPVAFSEIEKFPSEVLKHHYPHVPNLGDMTKYKEWELNEPIDILVGGTPCQSFSVAGLRKGLEDPRGNLMLTYVGILDKFRPKWCVWENVPGVLSSNGGKDFGSFLSALVELGYGWAYRVLDAQYFGVAQRRRRVFVVGCLGDWRSAAKVLFESESLQRHIKPSRETRKEITSDAIKCFAGNQSSDIASTLQTTCHDWSRSDGFNMVTFDERNVRSFVNSNFETFPSLCASDYKGAKSICYENHGSDSRIKEIDVSPTITARWGTGGNNVPLTHPISFDLAQITIKQNGTRVEPNLPVSTLAKGSQMHCAYALQGAGVTSQNANGDGYKEEQSYTLNRTDIHAIANNMAVRRLTPIECERLQGFPNNYTNIKDNCPDGPRYKALGNSMAVPVMKWIGERINDKS
jgi:DNA (cytosine-5)-methyltransferase 1